MPSTLIVTFKTESKSREIIQLEVNELSGELSVRLNNASSFNESARAFSGMGAARTATRVRKEIASKRDEMMINIWGALWGLSEGEMG